MMADADASSRPGIAVDSKGGAVIDPTQNVLSLVDAAVHRIDDLRFAETRRVDDLRSAEMRRLDEVGNIRAHYMDLLSAAEAKRIDAIRAVDVNAVAVANDRATQQAVVLANQVTASADALRALVATTTAQTQQAQSALTNQLNERIASLERAASESKGRQAYSDPAMAELISEMKRMTGTQSEGVGKHEGISMAVAMAVAAITIAVSLFGGGLLIRGTAAPAQHDIIYLPTPSQSVPLPQPIAPK